MEEHLLNEFEEFGLNPNKKVLEKCIELLKKYNITPDTLVNHWIGYTATKLNDEAPSLENLILFEKDLAKELSAKTKVKSEPLSESPIIHNITTITQMPGTSSKFSSRNNAGEVVVKYPADDAAINWTRSNESWEPDIQLQGTAETKLTTKYNYMFSRLRDKFEVLEEQINDLGDLMKNKLGIDDFEPNCVLKSETFHTVGRICCDATSGSRLNTSSLLLEGTRNTSSGQSVPLDVSQLKEFSFFPGQVIAVEGSNPTGKKMVVTSISTPPINSVFKTDVSIEVNSPLNMMVACGPFTLPDDLEFAPLVEFIQQVNTLLPHIVIIMGPFVDVKNKKVECGDLDYTYQEQFDIVMRELQSKITNSVQVCIIPSWRDVHYRAVYPTPPFPQENKAQNFSFFSDPCILNVNGVFIALTSTDILFHLSKEEIAVTPHGSDRLGRLVSHLFSQQSFYPLNPPSEEMSIDLEQAEDHCKLSFTPHLLFVPSDLRHFIKNVGGCVVVNMERAVKGFCGGTYSRLQITGEASSVQIKAEIVRL
uniref:DNA polymerase alpha subunit B n=1 Tax=Daphnia similis TaxID=35528 RepID=A0A4Y7N022_9CRUS|nr:EOG090X07VJ [Daphnia similis]SVE86811.1 EOG090X07VJ [Daphnia similis]